MNKADQSAIISYMKQATIGGGCFWCLEAVYQRIKGIQHVESGYMGGHIDNPTYKQVCTGTSGHAEIIRIDYDETLISYEDILKIFFLFHDPTTLNRQGNDVGTQYRSVIYYHDEQQQEIASQVINGFASELYDDPVVTELSALETYYKAEAYHQNYYNDNTRQGYCQFVITPKVMKLRSKFQDLLKSEYADG